MKLRSGLLVFLVVLVVFSGACAAPKQPVGEAAKGEIVIGFLDDMSGPLASLGSQYVNGQNDAIRYINEEKGGIKGHPLRAITIDYKMDTTLAISGWDRLEAQRVPVVFSVTSAGAAMLGTASQTDRITLISGGGTIDQLLPREKSYFFSTVPWYYGVFESLAESIKADWAKKGETGQPRVGYDIIAFGNFQKIFTKCAKMTAEKYGFQYTITYTGMAPADVTTQLLQMKNFDCDYLYLMGGEVAIIAWLKELNRQSFKPRTFGSTGLAAAEVFQATGDLCAGTTYYTYGPQWTDVDVPMIALLHELNTKWYPDIKVRPGHYCRSFGSFLAVMEAMNRAIDSVGYEKLNTEAMQQALETIRDYQPGGGSVPYTWTAQDHQGIHGCMWYTWNKDGSMTRASKWYEFNPLAEEQKTTAWWLQ